MNHYDDLQRFKEKTRTHSLKFKDLSSEADAGKKGDWVIFARYAGSRLPIEGGEVRLLNDDEVLGTIKNPEDVLHHI